MPDYGYKVYCDDIFFAIVDNKESLFLIIDKLLENNHTISIQWFDARVQVVE